MAGVLHPIRFKEISDLHHLCEAGSHRLRVWTLRVVAFAREPRLMAGKLDTVTCILVVATAVLVGIARCSRCANFSVP